MVIKLNLKRLSQKTIAFVLVFVFTLAILVVSFYQTMAEFPDNFLHMHFFNAGKADATLIYCGEQAVLIDAGEDGFGETILEYIKAKGLTKLDYLVVTHFDEDHVGGAAEVINNIPIDHVIQSNYPKDSTEYDNYIAALAEKNIEAETPREDLYVELGEYWRMTVNPPAQEEYKKNPSNNSSLITSITFRHFRAIFLGDAEKQRVFEYARSQMEGSSEYTLFKLPHHGAYVEHMDFLYDELTDPLHKHYAVITTEREDQEDSALKEFIKSNSIHAYYTRNGAIDITVDGSTSITVKQ